MSDWKKEWNILQREVAQTAQEKGWREKEQSDGELLALIHSEVSEALEAFRMGNPMSDKFGVSQAEEELADVVIRIMDMAALRGLDVPTAVILKMNYNTRRAHRHGGKLF